MRYLRGINERKYIPNDEKRTEELFSPLIDWDMIKDIREMSLEYLDYGKSLAMGIHYDIDKLKEKLQRPGLLHVPDANFIKIKGSMTLYITRFSHEGDNYEWQNLSAFGPPKADAIDYLRDKVAADDIFYSLYITNTSARYTYKRDTKQLISRIKLEYPDKNIRDLS